MVDFFVNRLHWRHRDHFGIVDAILHHCDYSNWRGSPPAKLSALRTNYRQYGQRDAYGLPRNHVRTLHAHQWAMDQHGEVDETMKDIHADFLFELAIVCVASYALRCLLR